MRNFYFIKNTKKFKEYHPLYINRRGTMRKMDVYSTLSRDAIPSSAMVITAESGTYREDPDGSRKTFKEPTPAVQSVNPFDDQEIHIVHDLLLVFERCLLQLFGSIGSSIFLLFQFRISRNMALNTGVLESRFLRVISSSLLIGLCSCIIFLESIDFFLGFLDVLDGREGLWLANRNVGWYSW